MTHVHRNFTTARPQDIWILGSPLATHGMAGLRRFSFIFPYVVYCAMMVNADDMNHVLLLFPSKTNICQIGLPTPLECNVRNYIRPG